MPYTQLGPKVNCNLPLCGAEEHSDPVAACGLCAACHVSVMPGFEVARNEGILDTSGGFCGKIRCSGAIVIQQCEEHQGPTQMQDNTEKAGIRVGVISDALLLKPL